MRARLQVWLRPLARRYRSQRCPKMRSWRSSASQGTEITKEMRQTIYIVCRVGRRNNNALEENASANLDDAVAKRADVRARDRSEDGRVQRCVWRREIGQVEYVRRLATELEGQTLVNWEVAEDRGVDVTTSRSIQRILPNRSIGAGWTSARTGVDDI